MPTTTSACPSLAGRLAPTPIVKARHSPHTPPYPTQKTPLIPARTAASAAACYTYPPPVPPSHSQIPPTQHSDRNATRTDAMATLTVPSSVPAVAEDCEQLHKAFEGPTPTPDRIPHSHQRALSLHAPTTDALRVSDRSQVGAPTRS